MLVDFLLAFVIGFSVTYLISNIFGIGEDEENQ